MGEDEDFVLKHVTIPRNTKRYESCSAVSVQNAFKSYGRRKKVKVLQNLNMKVNHGAIYGLLGPSGCGKTTLLGCLVNRLKLDKGQVTVFGFEPGSKEAGVPGNRVGYMPQDLALHPELTLAETLIYFGRINSLSSTQIKTKSEFMIELLRLPDRTRLISQLSGGQQRRVSLACALLHSPELLILDEPTVGVDPLLRTNIWNHLTNISSTTQTTIIITTHYIEEAKQAHKVGLMRGGRLLAETSPDNLLAHFNITSLEEVFLRLCLQDGDEDAQKNSEVSHGANNISTGESNRGFEGDASKSEKVINTNRSLTDFDDHLVPLVKPSTQSVRKNYHFSFARTRSLLIKNVIKMKRTLAFLVFSFLLPPVQISLFCLTIGGKPLDLPMAVVNLDSFLPRARPALISDLYLDNLNPEAIVQTEYGDFDSGYSSVVDGKNWGLIFFNESFTKDIVGDQNSDGDGTIHVYMDNTNQQISWTIQIELYQTLAETIRQLVALMPGFDPGKLSLPLQIEDQVYGHAGASFTEFMAPGIILLTVYFMAMGLTALSYIVEKKEGVVARVWVAGVQTYEVMLSHIAAQTMVMSVQILLVVVFMFVIFNIPCEGSILLVILMAFIQGYCGMTFGLLISAMTDDEKVAIIIILGVFFPIFLLTGIVWPLEAMPTALSYLSYALPQTYACDSLRSIMYRGWGLSHFQVWIGYVVTLIWLVLQFLVSTIAMRLQK